jgi:hypothetical protein
MVRWVGRFLVRFARELAEASKRAESDSLKLEVEEVTVSLGVAVTLPGRARYPPFPSPSSPYPCSTESRER